MEQSMSRARERVREQVDRTSTQAGERMASTASDARSVAEQLRSQGKEQPAKLAEQAAERADRVASYMRESDADRMLRDVEDFGRRQPWVIVAGGLALGFAASRFLKASSRNRYRSSLGEGGRPRATPAAPAEAAALPAEPVGSPVPAGRP
jgi:ElaB/YqjD/DUF883 family membrane-anchored ribosome-binding protein